MRKFWMVPWLLATAWARPGALTVQVDLNLADLTHPLHPQHEVAFQLEARPPGQEGAPGGEIKVYRLAGSGQPQLVASLHRDPQKPDSPQAVKATGYLYRQLFVWPGWAQAGKGRYLAQYQQDPKLKVHFQLP